MLELRPYQQEAVAATIRYFQKEREPALLVLPTGAGKSLVIAALARVAKGRVLVLAHVKELVEQNHAKFVGYGTEAGIYAAGLARKDQDHKVIFGSIQSVARADAGFFKGFSLLIIDECHRVALDEGTQYAQVVSKLRAESPQLCILGLTATPYRLGLGWIYQYHVRGTLRTAESRFFKKCIYELSLRSMIEAAYLTPPLTIDSPVASYDFSSLKLKMNEKSHSASFSMNEIENVLKDQKRVTPVIVSQIIELAHDRSGVMIFTASVRHAEEILQLLPPEQSALVVGETATAERDQIIRAFKERKLKFLVNVSVLTTGFDAPHVDLIALLRPTESVSLYQQIVGRGLRLSPEKKDCLVLDYTGQGHKLYHPEIDENRPNPASVPVEVPCPLCGHINSFWGLVDEEGTVIEHFGRKCQGAQEDPETRGLIPCSYRYRFKSCPACSAENDIAARVCSSCREVLVDNDKKLREALSLKNAHVLRPEEMILTKKQDKVGKDYLEVRYYDQDGQSLREFFYLSSQADRRVFQLNFMRMHLKRPEFLPLLQPKLEKVDEVVHHRELFRLPLFVIARKRSKFWEVREKIFE